MVYSEQTSNVAMIALCGTDELSVKRTKSVVFLMYDPCRGLW